MAVNKDTKGSHLERKLTKKKVQQQVLKELNRWLVVDICIICIAVTPSYLLSRSMSVLVVVFIYMFYNQMILHGFCLIVFNHFPTNGDFCRLLITFVNSLDPDQDQQNARPDLDPNCLTL